MKIRHSVILLVVASAFFDIFILSIFGIGEAFASGERVRVACLDMVRNQALTNENHLSAQERDLQSLRAHILLARERAYKAELPDRMSSFSGGSEHDVIVPVSLPDSHAFYLDSGTDVFRLMLDFPGERTHAVREFSFISPLSRKQNMSTKTLQISFLRTEVILVRQCLIANHI
jgi:hypothetical protein